MATCANGRLSSTTARRWTSTRTVAWARAPGRARKGVGGCHNRAGLFGIDVSKLKAEACIRSLQLRLSQPSTPAGEQELIAWLSDNRVGLAVMEASGGYERGWAQILRKAGIAVRIVDPKRVAI